MTSVCQHSVARLGGAARNPLGYGRLHDGRVGVDDSSGHDQPAAAVSALSCDSVPMAIRICPGSMTVSGGGLVYLQGDRPEVVLKRLRRSVLVARLWPDVTLLIRRIPWPTRTCVVDASVRVKRPRRAQRRDIRPDR